MTDLQLNTLGAYSKTPIFADPVLQTGGILIDQDAYTAGLTYTYDVRGLALGYVEINNEGSPANGLTFTIEIARKNYSALSGLVDADFDIAEKADTNVASGAQDITNITISPEITALRIRVKRQTTVQNATFNAIASFS